MPHKSSGCLNLHQQLRCCFRFTFVVVACSSWLLIPQFAVAEDLEAIEFSRPSRKPVEFVTGHSGIVVSETPLASDVGCQILADGGNAVDAAVGTAFALAVTWPEAGNIGGGGFMMVAPPEDDVVCVEYRETAPSVVNEKSFIDWENRCHARMAGVPGMVRGMQEAHMKFGKLSWKDLIQPSIDLSRDGIVVNEHLAFSLNSVLKLNSMKTESRYTEFREVYAHPKNYFWKTGDKLVQPDLSATLTMIAIGGSDAFYEGEIAEAIIQEMERQDGFISKQDLMNYQAVVRPAESGTFNGYTVYGAPPPSSGGITVLLQLKILEALKLEADPDYFWNVDHVHLMTEAMRRSFRERAAWLGDPDFITINEKVRDRDYAKSLASTIHPDRATSSKEIAGTIPLTEGPYESLETTHFSIIDADGMAVSNTYTLEGTFGCRIIPEGTGFLLNNEMGDFNWQPGYTDLQGRIGTKPNLIAPGKRMLSSQSPTIVKQDGNIKLILGSPGGRTIINTVSELLVQLLLFESSVVEAVNGPRFHHQWFPDVIKLESHDDSFDGFKDTLFDRGHQIEMLIDKRQGSAQVIEVNQKTGKITGVADWRRGSAARAVKNH